MTMVTPSKVLSASVFKAQCLAVMDEVARTGETVIITKNGKPVAQLGPTQTQPRRDAFGLHKGRVKPIGDVDLNEPVLDPAEWTADKDNLL